jgi:serum amyloid A protein
MKFLYCVLFILVLIGVEINALNLCSANKMRQNYNEMKRANCLDCDPYFHCMGNYEAVYKCRGYLKRTTAKILSDARELFGGDDSGSGADSAADQQANLYGRKGGDCGLRYLGRFTIYDLRSQYILRSGKCAYNPDSKTCGWNYSDIFTIL